MGYLLVIWLLGVIGAVFFLVMPAEGLGYWVRIAFIHIPTAWVSVLAFFLAAYWASLFLRTQEFIYDYKSAVSIVWGLIFCLIATISGAIFAKLTWGAYWNWDPRQTCIFALFLIYCAYIALRMSIDDREQKAKISSVYALFSCIMVPFLTFILPRLYLSLHPQPIINNAGKVYMDATMIYVLAAAICGLTGFYAWFMRFMISRQSRLLRSKNSARSEAL